MADKSDSDSSSDCTTTEESDQDSDTSESRSSPSGGNTSSSSSGSSSESCASDATPESGSDSAADAEGQNIKEPPLYEGARITREESRYLILEFSRKVNLADRNMQDLLDLINVHLKRNTYTSSYNFFKTFEPVPFVRHFLCLKCHGNCVEQGGMLVCEECSERSTPKVLLSERSYFTTMSVEDQIGKILQQKDVIDAMEVHLANKRDNSIVNSRNYELLKETGTIMPHDLTLQFNTDGVMATKSSKLSFWPIFLSINELPLRLRNKYMMLCGVWMCRSKPKMDLYLEQMVQELKNLHEIGLPYLNGRRKIHLIISPVDSPARAILVMISYPGGKYACCWCYVKARSISKGKGTTRVFDFDGRIRKRRTPKNYLRHAVKVQLLKPAQGHYKGIKAVSILAVLPPFNIVTGWVVEYLHALCSGGFEAWLISITCAENKAQPYSVFKSMQELNSRFMKIRPPNEITRLPEPLNNPKHLKAHVKKNLLCYFVLILMHGILDQTFLNHIFLLVYAIRVYLQGTKPTEHETSMARMALHKFVRQLPLLLKKPNVLVFNMHILTHLPDIFEAWGGIWDASTFPYESKNGAIAKLHHGTKYQGEQILKNYARQQYLLFSPLATNGFSTKLGQSLHEQLQGGISRLKKTVSIDDTHLLGAPDPKSTLKKCEMDQLIFQFEQYSDADTIQVFQRCILNGSLCSTFGYGQEKKRMNCYFKTNSGDYVCVESFILWTEISGSRHILVNCRPLKKLSTILASDDTLGIDTRSFLCEVSKQKNKVVLLTIQKLGEKVIGIDSGKKLFVSPFTNLHERD